MKACYCLILLFELFSQLGSAQKISFNEVKMDTIYAFRGLSVVNDSIAWVSGRFGTVGLSQNGGKDWSLKKVEGFERSDFRSLYAFSADEALIATTQRPASILRTSDGGKSWTTVYQSSDSLFFFDGMDFWNEREGIIYGDPVNGRMLLLKTKDGGRSWKELPERQRPLMSKGEASFAASGTGIRCVEEKKLLVCTGGMVSRLLVSENRGRTWSVLSPPVIQGKAGTGIFSVAYISEKELVIVGGDFDKNAKPVDHVYYSRDGGSHWYMPTIATGGYRSCVERISKDLFIAVGPSGMDVSRDGGLTWNGIESQENFNVIRKARKGHAVIAAGRNKITVLTIDP